MKVNGKLTFSKGTAAEMANTPFYNTLFYTTDTQKFYLFDGTTKIEIGGGGATETTGYTGEYDPATQKANVVNGVIKTVESL